MADENTDDQAKRISINKVYLKDLSFESPQAPSVFAAAEWKPKTNLNLSSSHTQLDNNIQEVVLTITIEAKDGDTTFFLVEIQQAGLFEVAGYDVEEFNTIVGSFCPSILYPYAREAVAGVIQKGGFPEFVLQPINFDALYVQSRQHAAESAQAEAAAVDVEKH